VGLLKATIRPGLHCHRGKIPRLQPPNTSDSGKVDLLQPQTELPVAEMCRDSYSSFGNRGCGGRSSLARGCSTPERFPGLFPSDPLTPAEEYARLVSGPAPRIAVVHQPRRHAADVASRDPKHALQ
jgi:hypothetical protein